MKCFACGDGVLAERPTQIEGELKGEKYAVNIEALVCSVCGHVALEGNRAPEYMRRLADAYRTAHDLLTSDEIRNLRRQLGMTQQGFAKALGVGPASVKRWELGLVQGIGNNALMVGLAQRLTGGWSRYEFEKGKHETGHRMEAVFWVGLAHGPPGFPWNLIALDAQKYGNDNLSAARRTARRPGATDEV